jgi:hypothetical protein
VHSAMDDIRAAIEAVDALHGGDRQAQPQQHSS